MAATKAPPTTTRNGRIPGHPLKSSGLEARVVTITPAIAREWLKMNKGNRTPKRSSMERYARDMTNDEWQITGEPIIFDSNGDLRNGQNRLMACEKSEAAFTSLVVWGVKPEAFKNMDRAAPRTQADVLYLNGEVDSKTLAGALAFVRSWKNGLAYRNGGRTQPTVAEAEALLQDNPGIRPSIQASAAYRRLGQINLGISPALSAYLHLRLAMIDGVEADQFFEALYTGTIGGKGLNSGNPIKALQAVLANAQSTRRRLFPDEIVMYVFKTWNKWRDGEKLTTLKIGSTEKFPEIH